MEDTITDVPAVSSPASPETPAPSSATTVNTDPNGAPPQATEQVPFHQHPRWQEVIKQNQQFRGAMGQMQAQIQKLTAAQTPPGQPASPEYTQAAEALIKIFESNPRLKTLLGLSDAAPELMRGYEGVQTLTKAQQQSVLRSGRSQIQDLATKADLPNDKDTISHYEALVTDVIARNPDYKERFINGDASVVSEAFATITKFIASLRRPAAASVAATKQKLSTLPPAPRGGLPGQPASEKPVPGKEREFEQALFQKGRAKLAELFAAR